MTPLQNVSKRRRLELLLLAIVAACAWDGAAARAADEPNRLSALEAADGWLLLFDGHTLFGWQSQSDADWQVKDGAIVAGSGSQGLLTTTSEFADYALKVDFRSTPRTNSGVFLRTAPKPTDPAKDCYELNIADPSLNPYPTGSFVNRQKAEAVSAADDAWHTFEVTALGGRFNVSLDGRPTLAFADPAPLGRGHIGLQFREGPIEFRNIKLKPLSLEAIFNGHDLGGWHVLPDHKSVFSVLPADAATGDGALNVKNGNGALESESKYADFVLQLDVYSNGKGLNSGVFFRAIPGEFWNGYECQVNNAMKDEDREKPKDYGTGAIYRRQPARRIVADDFAWFTLTLAAAGPHMAAWVNGYPVSDWTDDRAPNANPRKGLRTEAGTLQIQGHDPTTDLSFRRIKIAELPPR